MGKQTIITVTPQTTRDGHQIARFRDTHSDLNGIPYTHAVIDKRLPLVPGGTYRVLLSRICTTFGGKKVCLIEKVALLHEAEEQTTAWEHR